ncbi:hypothetical protein [Candidatus Magnetominusculus xianensis]|uniref:Secreted protein n=1 Tax=Candidatus Magnetominusculus xianensis TaxID=1748249 RepID=A0ABR5SE23_9BACT|nr:hypothetical protein [Candidatus Magnetominusculus xianensis]KWT81153.1 hypothetical protein ASN18_2659 [Candidatus Magnetominusculus xianensis]MBF0402983.1 hypothetical protein [Nitrospirota bacterium]
MNELNKLIVVMAIVVFAGAAAAEQFIMFENMTTAGEGKAIRLIKPLKDWTCQVNYTGNPDNLTVSLLGSVDGTHFEAPFNNVINAKTDRFVTVNGSPVKYVRGKIVNIAGGTAPEVTMICEGM